MVSSPISEVVPSTFTLVCDFWCSLVCNPPVLEHGSRPSTHRLGESGGGGASKPAAGGAGSLYGRGPALAEAGVEGVFSHQIRWVLSNPLFSFFQTQT